MSHWAKPHQWTDDVVDLDIIEESALAMAQSTIQNAINKSGISRSEMARRMGRNRSFISRMLTGSHNLTVKTLAKSLAVCGFEVRLQPTPLEWNWAEVTSPPKKELEPANAGSGMLSAKLSMPEPALTALGE
jgi:transcriptional regulator with XRE-family HTH domain